jgi:gamma-glutamylcyclotransferase (GGCT)/AIG2-like uncharacterized protein YtfP
MLYFAYGSNLSWEQMNQRCPSARFVGVGVLPDHKLAFTRKSVNRGCGVADALPENGAAVWGVVFQIDDVDIGKLDASEGYKPGRSKNSYFRRETRVLVDGDHQRPLETWVYFANRERNAPLPNAAYKDLIVSGAKYWHLPHEYVRQLEQVVTSG